MSFIDNPYYQLVLAAVAFAIIVYTLFFRRRQPANITAYLTGSGRVMVTRSAITELVQTSCKQIKDVTKPNIKIYVKQGRTNLEVRLKLTNNARLIDIASTLKEHLKNALEDNLGIENLGDIDITVTGFKSGKLTQKRESTLTNADDAPQPEDEFSDMPVNKVEEP